MSTISHLEDELDRLENDLKTLIGTENDSDRESSSEGSESGPYYDITIKDLTDECKDLLSAYGISLAPNFVIARLCSVAH